MNLIDKLKTKFNEIFPDQNEQPLSDKLSIIIP